METQIQTLLARMKEIDKEQEAIETAANLENGGKFTAEQSTKYDALQAEYDGKKEEKLELERQLGLRSARLERAKNKELEAQTLPRRTDPNAGSQITTTTGELPGKSVESGQNGNGNGETRINFKIPRNVVRIGRPQNFQGTQNGYSAEERAYRFGMWALACIGAHIPRFQFPKAQQFVRDYMQATNLAHGESEGTTGGQFLVPEEFSSDIIILRERYGVSRRLLARSVMTTDVKHEPKRNAGLTSYFVNEGSAATESNMSWQDIQLVAKDLMCLARMSNQLSMDAVVSVGDTLAGEIAYEFSRKEDDCAFNGTGTSTYGGINGVRNQLLNGSDGGGQSAGLFTGTGAGWSGLILGDFNNTAGLLPQYADTENTCWVTHKAFYYGVMQRLELAAGGVTALEVQRGGGEGFSPLRPRPLFLGYPVEFSQIWPSSTASGVMAALGEFTLGGLLGDRMQVSIAFSEHAVIGGESVFERNQIAIRGVERFDMNIHGCGTSSSGTPASLIGPIVGIKCG